MRYLIYSRVSERGSDWHGDTSCQTQIDECRRHVLSLDTSPSFIEVQDEFKSGRTVEKRPALVAALANPSTWDVLVVLDMDRLARSLDGWVHIAKTLTAAGKGLLCIRQNMDYRTPQGRMLLSLFAVIAEYFARSNAEKTRDKMLSIARKGEWPAGKIPTGYRRAGKSQNALVVDPPAAEKVRAIFADACTLHVTALARKYNLPLNTLRKMLKNPTYTGRIHYGPVDLPGKHPAIIDQATWDRVQSNHPAKTPASPRPARQQYPYALTGKVRCSEGHAMSPATCRGKGGQYPYYRCLDPNCKAPHRYVRADQLEVGVCDMIYRLGYDQEQIEAIADDVAKRIALMEGAHKEGGSVHDRLQRAETRLQRLTDALTAAMTLPDARQAILRELDSAERETRGLREEAKRIAEEAARISMYRDADTLAKEWQLFAEAMAKDMQGADPASRRAWCQSNVVRVIIDEHCRPVVTVDLVQGSTRTGTWHPEGLLVELHARCVLGLNAATRR